jgi:tRNA 2-thiocytidine biosynthesis protein TtcA
MVCLSGGKDSYALLSILMLLKESAPIHFDIIAVNLDQKQPGFPEHILPNYLDTLGIEYHIVEENTYAIVKDKIPEGKTTCSLCSRLRRAVLYKAAKNLGATKIALGHHRDDMIETLMLNMFYGGKMKAMPAKLVSDNGEHVVIRPLAFCKETELIQYGELKKFPIIPCNLCGSQPNLQRQNIKRMLQEWHEQSPGRIESMFTAMRNVVPSHLCDSNLFDFKGINNSSGIINGGDTAFDAPLLERRTQETSEDSSKLSTTHLNELNVIEVK